jgi:hypothetical protein
MYVCICREWLKTEWFENDLKIAQSKQKTKLGNQSLIHELKGKTGQLRSRDVSG